jgi:hypothetical protein
VLPRLPLEERLELSLEAAQEVFRSRVQGVEVHLSDAGPDRPVVDGTSRESVADVAATGVILEVVDAFPPLAKELVADACDALRACEPVTRVASDGHFEKRGHGLERGLLLQGDLGLVGRHGRHRGARLFACHEAAIRSMGPRPMRSIRSPVAPGRTAQSCSRYPMSAWAVC